MVGEWWTDYDEAVLDSMGIDATGLVAGPGPVPRSEWEPERILQAAADGELHVYGLDEGWSIVRLWIDGRTVTVDEQEHINDLVISEHLVIVGTRVALTALGRETLARWAKYQRIQRKRGEQ